MVVVNLWWLWLVVVALAGCGGSGGGGSGGGGSTYHLHLCVNVSSLPLILDFTERLTTFTQKSTDFVYVVWYMVSL